MANISAHNLSMRFGDFVAISDVSFDVASGEFVTLLGPSGCGKTTLLKMISGFLTPSDGHIKLNGVDITDIPPEKRDTALCFQSYALFPHLTVLENLEFGLRQKGIAPNERKTRIDNVCDQLELGAQLEKMPNKLSGGQQQRVALGRALVMQPSVILFDEPLSNLDAKLRDQVRIEIHRIQRKNKLTAIYVTHDQSEALALSDRVFVMNSGHIEQAANPEDLYHRPRTGFVADFIGDANVVDAQVCSYDGDVVELETVLGPITSHSESPPVGQRIKISWRPERARFNGEGSIRLAGIVKHRSFQGHFVDLQVETNGHVYRVQAPECELQPGDDIQFTLNPKDIVLLEDIG